MNTIDYLTRFENDCLDFYNTLGSKTSDPELRKLYELLADNRQRHLDSLNQLKETILSGEDESELLERADHIMNGFRQTLLAYDISKVMRNDRDAFDHVFHAEEDMIRLCEGVAGKERNEKVRELLHWFVADEKQHLQEMEGIYEFVETPQCYLEWGEFSNLRSL